MRVIARLSLCSVIGCNAILGIEAGRGTEASGGSATAGSAGNGGGGSANGGSPNDAAGAGGTTSQAGAAGGAGGTTSQAGAAASTPLDLKLPIATNADDCTWINGTDERLYYSSSEQFLEVGDDEEQGRVGLRFAPAIPRNARITHAVVRLERLAGTALAADTIKFQIFDTSALPVFDDAHTHEPAGHAELWPSEVVGVSVGESGKQVESAQLKDLVQHVVDRADWSENGALGFLVSADKMSGRWVSFVDQSQGEGRAVLSVTYTLP